MKHELIQLKEVWQSSWPHCSPGFGAGRNNKKVFALFEDASRLHHDGNSISFFDGWHSLPEEKQEYWYELVEELGLDYYDRIDSYALVGLSDHGTDHTNVDYYLVNIGSQLRLIAALGVLAQQSRYPGDLLRQITQELT